MVLQADLRTLAGVRGVTTAELVVADSPPTTGANRIYSNANNGLLGLRENLPPQDNRLVVHDDPIGTWNANVGEWSGVSPASIHFLANELRIRFSRLKMGNTDGIDAIESH